MRALAALIGAELIKLKRTLALWMILLAPAIVVTMQVALWLNRKQGWEGNNDLWKIFSTSIFSMWAIFMFPLFSALVVALIYQHEHTTNGWLKLYTLPVPKWSIVAAKQIVSSGIVLVSTLVLIVVTILGGLLMDALHPKLTLPAAIPLLTMVKQASMLFLSALAIIAIQNWVSMRWSTLSVSIGVGISGTFLALFASGWKYGHLYPWLIPIRVLHGTESTIMTAFLVGAGSGIAFFIAALYHSATRDVV